MEKNRKTFEALVKEAQATGAVEKPKLSRITEQALKDAAGAAGTVTPYIFARWTKKF